MTVAWPDYLPNDVVRGAYNEEIEVYNAKHAPEVGETIFRRRSRIATEKVGFTIQMTTAEVALFLQFYQSELFDGTLTFTFTDPRKETTSTFSFVAPPSISAISYNRYSVKFSLRRMP